MKYKKLLGSAVLGFTIILLTFGGAVTQAQITSMQTNYTPTSSPVFIEELKVVAGIDSAALVELLLIGEDAPDIASDTRFNDVENWLFIASDQEDYASYLVRRPFKAPENATLILEIDGGLGAAGSLTHALGLAGLFGLEYGVSLMWSRVDVLPNGNYLYYFTGEMPTTIFNTLITEFQADITSGFVSALDGVTVGSAPVKAVAMGEGMIEGGMKPIRGVFYVDDNAITGTTVYTLSTNNLFGALLTPYSGLSTLKYSILKFRFPYTINPTSITPRTDNFAPHITGKMDWNLNLPWKAASSAANYEVVFNIDHSKLISSPKVTVNMAYDQDELNNNGRLQMDYVVKNIGTEDATNIDINYPLGPDFLDFLASKPNMWMLDADVTVNETFNSDIDATINILFSGSLFTGYSDIAYTQIVLVLDGWYNNLTDGSMVNINPANQDVLVKSDTAGFVVGPLSGSITTEARIHSDDGLSQILVDNLIAFLAPINLLDYTVSNIADIFTDYENELKDAVLAAGDELFQLLYEEQTIFDPDLMDFSFSVRDVGLVGETTRSEVFLNKTIDNLIPGASVNVSWALENIPAKDDLFGIMGLTSLDVSANFPALQLSTVGKTGYDLMRLIFGAADPGSEFTYSRPLSFFEPWMGNWVSFGAKFSYMDPEGFEYFGFSNGINLQVADDEAVLNVHVELNQTAYKVGDPVTVSYTIENTGDSDAENVQIYLYHGRMGNDWQIRDAEQFWYDNVAVISGGGGIYSSQADVLANSFLGIHPVYAVVEFDTDVGQPAALVDFGSGLVSLFEGAGESHQIVVSNMDWAMLLPKTTARRPAFPQPILQIDVDVDFIIPEDAPWELEITITITNVGEIGTTLTMLQFYNATEMDLLRRSTSKGNDYNFTIHGMGVILFTDITLAPGENVVITMRWLFLTSSGCYIPGIIIVYTSRYENELGDEGEVQPETDTEIPLLQALNGQSQDDEDWEDYGESTQTGTSAGADAFSGEHTRRMGSIDALYWSLGAIFITAVATTLRKKTKK